MIMGWSQLVTKILSKHSESYGAINRVSKDGLTYLISKTTQISQKHRWKSKQDPTGPYMGKWEHDTILSLSTMYQTWCSVKQANREQE